MRHLLAAIAAMGVAFSPAIAADKSLSIAAYEYPPFLGAELENNGFVTEIIRAALDRGGYKAVIDFLPWKRALASAQNGKHDALFTAWHRPEREEWFLFSEALPSNEMVFYKRADRDIKSSKYEDLKDLTVGVGRGYALPPGFEEAGLKISPANDDEENLRKLHKGRIDLVLTDRIVAQYILNSILPELAPDLDWIDPPVHVDIQYFVVSKKAINATTIMEDFNVGLAAITEDGTLTEIMAKHGF
jgi:polar amino acid transport system substrate-binding protein